VSKNGLFEPFIYKNDHFTKTGSGQTWGKLQKRTFFLRNYSCFAWIFAGGAAFGLVRERLFCAMFYTKTRTFTKTGSGQTQGNLNERDVFLQRLMPENQQVRKTPLFAPFIYKNYHFTKTGSGQT
jgi:hypothetical protein